MLIGPLGWIGNSSPHEHPPRQNNEWLANPRPLYQSGIHLRQAWKDVDVERIHGQLQYKKIVCSIKGRKGGREERTILGGVDETPVHSQPQHGESHGHGHGKRCVFPAHLSST